MAMNLNAGGGGDDEPMMDINTTPLIDVMLVLIIMLIITIPVQLHAVKLAMPQNSPPPPAAAPVVVEISIAPDGVVSWDQAALPDRGALESRLRLAAAESVQPELHLRPATDAPYGSVAMVLASAQRLGVTKLGMVGNERFAR